MGDKITPILTCWPAGVRLALLLLYIFGMCVNK